MHRLQANSDTRSKRWVFTINNFTEADIKAVESAKVNFLVYGKEHTEEGEGTPHLQGYVEFPVFKRRSTVCKELGKRAYCDPARGTAGECIEYCTKEGKFWMTDKGLQSTYDFYKDHPLPEYWSKQEKYLYKLMSNHENWSEEDLKFYIKEHDDFVNFMLSNEYPDMTRKDFWKKDWNDEDYNMNFHYGDD